MQPRGKGDRGRVPEVDPEEGGERRHEDDGEQQHDERSVPARPPSCADGRRHPSWRTRPARPQGTGYSLRAVPDKHRTSPKGGCMDEKPVGSGTDPDRRATPTTTRSRSQAAWRPPGAGRSTRTGRPRSGPRPARADAGRRDRQGDGALMAVVEGTLAPGRGQARQPALWTGIGLVVLLALAAATRFLELNVPIWLKDTSLAGVAKAIEYPIYAILLGLAANAVLAGARHVRERMRGAFRTEFFIKTGLVLLGASINLSVIVSAAGPAILQAILLISTIFLFTWWLGGRRRARHASSGRCSPRRYRSVASAPRSRRPAPSRRRRSSSPTRRASSSSSRSP